MRYDPLILEPFKEMLVRVTSFIPTLVVTLAILIIGCIAATLVRTLLDRVFKAIDFDKLADTIGVAGFLRKGGIKHKPGDLISCMTYLVLMVGVLITTVKYLGLTMVTDLIDKVLAYVPHVITGALVMIIGMLIAKFVSVLIFVTAKNTDMPAPAALARLSKLAIVVYVTVIYLKEVGFLTMFEGIHYTIFMGGIIFALALAFGLAGRDVAAKYLGVFKKTAE
ncbi:MAG: hypothetical protein KC684_09295 [Candidatus Omnitrophica bacterium]|nr:hypothetical protein [Candidatus Omnitrophota bacterium]